MNLLDFRDFSRATESPLNVDFFIPGNRGL